LAESVPDIELLELVRLTMIPGIGPLTCRALLEQFQTAAKVLEAPAVRLRQVAGVGQKLAERITKAGREIDAEAELAHCRSLGVRLLSAADPDYPAPLKDIPDPPQVLYMLGNYEPADALAIAIVGARRSTPYGLRVAERLASALARVGLTVVSGLARGIDAAAHQGALKAGGRTLAVLANGLSEVYPPEHLELARKISQAGALLSEMPLDQQPLPGLFPQRNRIISGLCLGVVVVEATPGSGSLVTAEHAMEQNREVFAVPGPVDSLASRGCHRLIRDGARLVETVDDILEELGPLVRAVPRTGSDTPVRHPAELALNAQERTLLGHLSDLPISIDELIQRTSLTASQVMATLSVLEMRRLVRRLSGQQFIRA
jgi:DNA processing protein